MKALNTVMALALGAGLGVLFGVLFAPEKGNSLRQRIADGANDLGDEVKKGIDKLTWSAQDTIREIEQDWHRNRDIVDPTVEVDGYESEFEALK